MAEMTTIKVRKPLADWLNSLKGYLEYTLSRKMTLDDALFSILGEIEILYAERQRVVNRANRKACEELVNYKINIFWKDDDDKPSYQFRTPSEWLKFRLKKNQNNK
jgi:hypothetical protein